MSGRICLCQYIGNDFKVFDKPEREVKSVIFGGKRYNQDRICHMIFDAVYGNYVCSECGAWTRTDASRTFNGASLKYCPNCGARVIYE